MASFELKLDGGKVVVWDGADGVDAARNYADGHPAATVVAWRTRCRHGCIHQIERPDRVRITEPQPGMGA